MREIIRECVLIVMVLAVGVNLSLSKPTKPVPIPEKKVGIPDLSGETNWGMLTHKGRVLEFRGHSNPNSNEAWEGTGSMREDGSFFVMWLNTMDGNICLSVYRIKGQELIGRYGFDGDCQIEKDGSITGSTRADTIYKVKGK